VTGTGGATRRRAESGCAGLSKTFCSNGRATSDGTRSAAERRLGKPAVAEGPAHTLVLALPSRETGRVERFHGDVVGHLDYDTAVPAV